MKGKLVKARPEPNVLRAYRLEATYTFDLAPVYLPRPGVSAQPLNTTIDIAVGQEPNVKWVLPTNWGGQGGGGPRAACPGWESAVLVPPPHFG
jgi:hypothetical protein